MTAELYATNKSQVPDTISIGDLLELWRNGFPIVPLKEDGVTQYGGFKSSDIYNNPDFWTEEEIKANAHLFRKVGTTFGKTHLKDKDGRHYYLNGLDTDSYEAYRRVEDGVQNSKLKTYVSKTQKSHGYHVYWLSTVQNDQIIESQCKDGHRFAIFTKNHVCTLPPSTHREAPHTPYKRVGQLKLAVSDDSYGKLRERLKDCLKTDDERSATIKDDLDDDSIKWHEGERNDKLHKAACHIIAASHGFMDKELLKNELHRINEKKCEPPLPEREVNQIFASAWKFILRKKARDSGNGRTKKEPVEEPKEPQIQLTDDITEEMSFDKVADIESCTVKEDYDSKVITTCGMLLAQTDNDQINVSPNAVSAAGKSYIALEIKEYFPKREVIVLGGASPTSFYYDRGVIDKERHAKRVSVKGKILILIDNPNYQFLQRMRPLFSHDQREIEFKLTNKNRSGANRTETIILEGFCSVFFCTTRINPDEQEQTRMIFVSPQTDQKKLEESLRLVTSKKCDSGAFHNMIVNNPDRQLLMKRILAIRQSGVREVMIPDSENLVFRRFMKNHKYLIPRHQRDLPRIISFIKAHALLNCFKREKSKEDVIIATQTDIDAGFQLYGGISDSNELGLSPFVHEIYTKVIKPMLNEDVGVERKEISKAFYSEFHRMIGPSSLQNIIEQLETVGLIRQEQDPSNKRKLLIYPIIIPDVGVHAANSSSGSDSANIDSYIDNKTEKECTPTPRIMISDDKSEDSVIYCPNGCNIAFATQEQVDEHCKDFH